MFTHGKISAMRSNGILACDRRNYLDSFFILRKDDLRSMNTAENIKKQKFLGKKGMVLFITLMNMFIPLSTDLYLPALPTMSTHFDASASLVNLTLVSFFFFFASMDGIAKIISCTSYSPSLLKVASSSDQIGSPWISLPTFPDLSQ